MAKETTVLVPLGECDARVVGKRIHNLIYGGRGGTPDPWVATDFPVMVRNYITPERAQQHIEELVRIAADSDNQRGFMAVVHDGTVIGMATYAQERLQTSRGWGWWKKTTTHADGPLLTYWLARPERRPRSPRRMLPVVLRRMAEHLPSNSTLYGRPWTLVRANRGDGGHVDACLNDPNNGFSGFELSERGEFPQVDGVAGERKLYVARYSTELFSA